MRGDTLYLYLIINAQAISTILLHEEDRVQRLVYYVSRALRRAEERYSPIDGASFALPKTAQKLQPYFQAHTLVVLTNLPLKKTLQNVEASGRLLEWVVELREFDIQYQPRHKIQGQAITDYLVEMDEAVDKPNPTIDSILEEPAPRVECNWIAHTDDSTNN